jgi:signal peptidase II
LGLLGYLEVFLKKYLSDYGLLFGVGGFIILLDQWTKYLVRTRLALGAYWSPWDWLTPYARIVHWNNTGAAFGMFQRGGTVFMILAVIVSIVIVYYFPQISSRDWPLRAALILQFGGAVGNLVDRITVGQVTDFVSVGNFAVFNIADSSITVGVIVLLAGIFIKDLQQKKTIQTELQAHKNAESDTGAENDRSG